MRNPPMLSFTSPQQTCEDHIILLKMKTLKKNIGPVNILEHERMLRVYTKTYDYQINK